MFKMFRRNEKGQGMVEYGLILALISVVLMGTLGSIGDNINKNFKNVIDVFGGRIEKKGFEARHNRTIGRTGLLKKEMVTGLENMDNNISIKIPANSNISGQIKSINSMTYGVYDADIKIPDNDGLLNGFFLYTRKNSKDYEIDIEILFRDGEWLLWTTIFNEGHPEYKDLHRTLRKEREAILGRGNHGLDGGEVFKLEQPLGFDPTKGYHNYKIDVSKNYIAFIVDGVERARWNESFEMLPLNLYVGSFYTFWLNRDLYNQLDSEDQHSLRTKGYDAYRSDGIMLGKMAELFGRSVDYSLDIKKVNINRK